MVTFLRNLVVIEGRAKTDLINRGIENRKATDQQNKTNLTIRTNDPNAMNEIKKWLPDGAENKDKPSDAVEELIGIITGSAPFMDRSCAAKKLILAHQVPHLPQETQLRIEAAIKSLTESFSFWALLSHDDPALKDIDWTSAVLREVADQINFVPNQDGIERASTGLHEQIKRNLNRE